MAGRLEREVEERMKRERQQQVVAEAVEVTPSTNEDTDDQGGVVCGVPRNCCYVKCAILFILLISGLAVGIIFATRGKATVAPIPIEVPTDSPVAATNAPTFYSTSERFQMLLDLVGPSVNSNIQLLQDPTTPQHDSLKWLADIDEWNPDVEPLPIQVLVERYVLALLYLSTNGKSWSTQTKFLQNTSVCEWFDDEEDDAEFIVCDGLYLSKLNFST
jgi:hypothetical protein